MRRRSRGPKDSLDLLLDTMCNAFGGIVLIAILVALLIEKPGDGERPETPMTREDLTLSRKAAELTRLENDIKTTEARYEKEKTVIDLIAKRNQLKKALETRRESEALSMVELNEKLGTLLEEKSKLLTEFTGLTSEIVALENTLSEKETTLAQLEAEMKNLIASRMSDTHPPELRDASGMQFNIIVEHDRVYPIVDLKFNDVGELYHLATNEDSIDWQGGFAIPRKTAGLTLQKDKATLTRIFADISGHNQRHQSRPSERIYIIFFVFQDSFELVDPLQIMVSEAGPIEDGWEPRIIGEPVGFSSSGKKSQTN